MAVPERPSRTREDKTIFFMVLLHGFGNVRQEIDLPSMGGSPAAHDPKTAGAMCPPTDHTKA
jgi:hypothetical protein